MKKFTLFNDEIHVEKPQDDLINNIIISIAIFIMIAVCGVIYIAGTFMEAVS